MVLGQCCAVECISDLNDKWVGPEVVVYLGCLHVWNKIAIVKIIPTYVMHMTPISNKKETNSNNQH